MGECEVGAGQNAVGGKVDIDVGEVDVLGLAF